MYRTWAAVAATFILAGCVTVATPYEALDPRLSRGGMPFIGMGYYDAPGPAKLYTVSYASFTVLSDERVNAAGLRRCAQIAKEQNKPYFLIFHSLHDAARERPAAEPMNTVVSGRSMSSAFILLLDQPRPGARETQAIIDELGLPPPPTPPARSLRSPT